MNSLKFLQQYGFWMVIVAGVFGYVAAITIQWALRRYAKRSGSRVAASLAKNSRRPLELLLVFSFGRVAQPLLNLHPDIALTARHAVTLILIFAFTWLLVSLTSILDEYLHDRLFVSVDDPKRARRIYTKVGLLRRFLVAIIMILGVASMLMTFPEARTLGASALAWAGIAGIILGVAARPAVETLIAGFQLALTDRIHIDDVVIVEGEWGWIEEITMTYVVVRIWDLRRLIVPITYFSGTRSKTGRTRLPTYWVR
ncbi:MAG: mechanosensitive ion channel family protein [Acidiferrobacterales bacterium]